MSFNCDCVARTCSSSNLRLLLRLSQHRLQFLIVVVERGCPLLILLRLLRHRRLLLRRKRNRRRLPVGRRLDTDCSRPSDIASDDERNRA